MSRLLTPVLVLLWATGAIAGDVTRYTKPIETTHGVFFHSFTVICWAASQCIAYRGGPSGAGGSDATAPDTSLVSSVEALTGKGNEFGNVLASVKSFDQSHPDFKIEKNGVTLSTYLNWPKTTLATGLSDAAVNGYFTKYWDTANTINSGGFKYNPANNNSNTTDYIGANAAGLSTTLPDAPLVKTRTPGWGHALFKEASVIGGPTGASFDGKQMIPAPPPVIVPVPPAPIIPQLVAHRLCYIDCRTYYDLRPEQLSAWDAFIARFGGSVSGVYAPLPPGPGPIGPLPVITPLPQPLELDARYGYVIVGPIGPGVEFDNFINSNPFSPLSGGTVFGPFGGDSFAPMRFSLPIEGDLALNLDAQNQAAVPEPGTWLLMGTGLMLLFWWEVRRRRVTVS